MGYRKLYEKEFNITIPSDYDIHHIDFDHSNNKISNLLLIPHALHIALHEFVKQYGEMVNNDNGQFQIDTQVGANMATRMFAQYAVLWEKLEYWIASKEHEMQRVKTPFNYNKFRNPF